MNFIKLALPALIAIAFAPAHAGGTVVEVGATTAPAVTTAATLGARLGNLAVFSYTASEMGASSIIWGSYWSGGVITNPSLATVFGNVTSPLAATLGNGALVTGSVVSGDVLTIGDGGTVVGSIKSTGASTVGANAVVYGNMWAGGVATISASGRVNGNVDAPAAPVLGDPLYNVGGSIGTKPVAADLKNKLIAQNVAGGLQIAAAQDALAALSTTVELVATQVTSTTFYAGVYRADSWTTTADITITLDFENQDNASFVFNFRDIFSTGASTKFVLVNEGANDHVVWNAYGKGGYVHLGASTEIMGPILATTYINADASAIVSGVDGMCGGIYSATSVAQGNASAQIGGEGCGFPAVPEKANPDGGSTTPVPEPETYALLLGGLAALGFVARRRSRAV